MAKSENSSEAAERFRDAAARIPKEQLHLRWAAQWLLLQAGDTLAEAQKLREANLAYREAKFYSGIFKDHLQPAAALRRAQVEMLKNTRWNQPYYWVGFVIEGERDRRRLQPRLIMQNLAKINHAEHTDSFDYLAS